MTRVSVSARAAAPPAPDDFCLGVAGRKLIMDATTWRFASVRELAGATDLVPLGTLDGVPVWAGIASTWDTPLSSHGWATLAAQVAEPLAALAGRALQVVTWRAGHRYCGACTAELSDVEGEHNRRCPSCGLFVPMQLSPAVLVMLRRAGSGELLLARHTYGPTGIWALVAGFVEAGESLEEAVHREVAEEVGLAVRAVRYFGSQPWAMSGPGVLLAGFTAETVDPAAEPVVDGRELAEARWFDPAHLPEPLPPPYSISRRLIDAAAPARP